MGFKFNVGDRVDYAFWPEVGQGSPGEVLDRRISVHTDSPFYYVRWDDGFTEPSNEPGANWWPESELTDWIE